MSANASNEPLSRDPDGYWTFAEYLPLSGTKRLEGKALPWILDPLGSFEPGTLDDHVMGEILKPSLKQCTASPSTRRARLQKLNGVACTFHCIAMSVQGQESYVF